MSKRKSSEAFEIYDCIPPWVAWQQSQRASVPKSVQSGINYSIILASACYIEGFFEKSLLRRTYDVQLGNSQLAERLLEELAGRISATTGSDRYNQMCELVTGTRASAMAKDNQLWETVKMLFHFRNMLAHGRSVGLTWISGNGTSIIGAEFDGGYAKIEEYLFLHDLITETYVSVGDGWHYFKDAIADHFWQAADRFVLIMQTNFAREDQGK